MPTLKPILKLTDAQWERLLERMISRGEGKAPVMAGQAPGMPGVMTRPQITSPLADASSGVPVGGIPEPTPGLPLLEGMRGAESIRSGFGAQTPFQQRAGIDFRNPDPLISSQIRAGETLTPLSGIRPSNPSFMPEMPTPRAPFPPAVGEPVGRFPAPMPNQLALPFPRPQLAPSPLTEMEIPLHGQMANRQFVGRTSGRALSPLPERGQTSAESQASLNLTPREKALRHAMKGKEFMGWRSWAAPSRMPEGGAAHPGGRSTRSYASPVDDIMAEEPPEELILSRLTRQRHKSDPGDVEILDLPYFEAREQYRKLPYSPENELGWKPVNIHNPRYKHIRTVPEGSPEDMGGGLNYRSVRFRPVESNFERRARKLQEERSDPMRITSKGEVRPEEASIEEVIDTGRILERLWQINGGKRGVNGQVWKRLQAGSKGRNRESDVRDYFIRSGLRWRENPELFARQFPREANILKEMWRVMEQTLSEVQ